MAYKFNIYESIASSEECFSVKKLENHLKNANDDELEIYINSGGGSVFEGLTIYNMLKRYKNKKTVYIDALSASIASVIAMAADSIIMPKNSMMMIHNALTLHSGNSKDFRKMAEDLDKITNSIKQTYLDKADNKIDYDTLTDLMNNETWLTADECFNYGLCTEVSDSVDAVACVDQDIFKNYKNTPDKFKNSIIGGNKIMNRSQLKNIDPDPKDPGIENIDNGTLFLNHARLFNIRNQGIEKISINQAQDKFLPTTLQKELISVATSAPMKNLLSITRVTYQNGFYEVPVLGFDESGELTLIDTVEFDMTTDRDKQLIKELPEYLSTVLAKDLFDAIKVYLASRATMKIETNIQNILNTKSKKITGKIADIRSLFLQAYKMFDRRMKDNLNVVLDYETYLKVKEILKDDITETTFLKINYFIDNSIDGFYLLDPLKIHTNIHAQVVDLDKNVDNGKFTSAITTWSDTKLTLTDEVTGIVKIELTETKKINK